MYPLLFNIGSIPVHTYGFLIALGFLTAVYVARCLALRAGLAVDKVIDLAFLCLLSGFLGARLLFVITRWDYFMQVPMDIFRVWEGGLVFYGGPLVAAPVAIWFMRRNKMSVWTAGDVILPGLTVAHMFGRFGCLAAGCCYGKATDSAFGIRFNSPLVEPALRGIPLHPTQLYEAFSLLVLFCGMLYIHKSKKFEGQVMLVYFMAYPIIRSLIEIFRGDLIRGFVIEDVLSTSQFISIGVFAVATAVLVWRLREVCLKQDLVV